MDTQTLLLVLAIGAIWLSVTCGCVALYLFLVRGRAGGVPVAQGAAVVSNDSLPLQPAPVLLNQQSAAWEVQVLFEVPSPALNDRLGVTLSSAGAVYEQRSKTFAVTGDSSRTPIVIENAVGAGQLPPLTESQASHPPVKGVSIKIVKNSRTLAPSKLQLAKLVSLSKKLARLGGTVVDAEQQPITPAGFNAVIQGQARV